jgi:hypothetical protein
VALRVRYEGSCLTGVFKCCVGRVNGKLENGFFAGGLLGSKLTFLMDGLDEVLFVGVSMVVPLGDLNMVIKWSMSPYSCRLCRICWA